MTRYTYTIAHVPGHGQRDHLYPDFVRLMEAWLPRRWIRPHNLRDTLTRFEQEARCKSQFDGKIRWRMQRITWIPELLGTGRLMTPETAQTALTQAWERYGDAERETPLALVSDAHEG